MKNLFLLLAASMLLMNCKETPKGTAESHPALSDSTQVAEVIHGFYKWYNQLVMDSTKNIDFVKVGGKHYTLDQQKLDSFLAQFKATGFVSSDFITNEVSFYQKCAQLWQTEEGDGVPLGMDANKYFCAQDWDIEFWTKAPVRLKSIGTDQLAATLFGTEGGAPREHDFELVKENGKWVLSKIACETGIENITPKNAEQALVEKLAAFYRGKTPCSDCAGVETVLTLNADQARTYSLEETHKGKKDRTLASSGTWSATAELVTLKKGSVVSTYQITDAGLISVNADGSKRDAKTAPKYLLKKVEGE